MTTSFSEPGTQVTGQAVLQRFPCSLPCSLGKPRAVSSFTADFDDFFSDSWRNGFVVFPEAPEITRDGLFNIAKRLLAGFALRDAPRQCWTAHDENAVFILLELNSVFHKPTLASGCWLMSNAVHLEPLSREAAPDRSPWVERSGTLGPKPCDGKAPDGAWENNAMDVSVSAAERCVLGFIDFWASCLWHCRHPPQPPVWPEATGWSPSSKKSIPCVFNKVSGPGIDTRNSSAMLIAVNQSDGKQCGTIQMEWRTGLCKGKKAPNPYISCRKLQKTGSTN